MVVVAFTRNAVAEGLVARLSLIGWVDVVELPIRDVVKRIEALHFGSKLLLNLRVLERYPRLDPNIRRICASATSNLYLFNDFHYIARYLLRRTTKPVALVEDGHNNYLRVRKPIAARLGRLLGVYPSYGRHPRIERILVQRPNELPPDVKAKGAWLDVARRLQTLPIVARSQIVHAFLGNMGVELTCDSVLILTQPFFDFGRVPHPDHVRIYALIANFFLARGSRVYLKPHPSDAVDYAECLPAAYVLPREFPIEILNESASVTIQRAVGVNTTAVHNIRFAARTINLLPHDRWVGDAYKEDLRELSRRLPQCFEDDVRETGDVSGRG